MGLRGWGVAALESLFASAAGRSAAPDAEWIARRPALVTLFQDLMCFDGGLGVFRLVHLIDAAHRAGNPKSIVSVGSGGGHHEAFLGWLYPDARVTGVDLREGWAQPRPANVRYLAGSVLDESFRRAVAPADLVISIEAFEHIDAQAEAAAAIRSLVAPGGWLYVEVPFASEAEQADETLCRQEREAHGHVRPGYTAGQLTSLFACDGLEVASVGNTFFTPLQPTIWLGMQHFGPEKMKPYWKEILAWARADLREDLAKDRSEATGVKILARRRERGGV
jgi:SAM-dependent methyltransferase